MISFARRSSRTFLLALFLSALAVFSLTRRRHGVTEVVKFQMESNARQALPDARSNAGAKEPRPGDEAPGKKSVHVVLAAASHQRGSSVIHVTVPKGRTDNSALGGDTVALANVGGKEVRKETIRLAKVDDELFGLGAFDVKKVSKIKIDAQGHEVEVLKGMQRLLAEIPSSTLVEVEYDPKMQVRAGYEESTLLDQAHSLGFDVYCGTVCYPKEGSQPSCPNITLRRASPSKAGLCKKSDESKKTDVGAGQGSVKDGMTSMAGENAAPASNGDKVQSILAASCPFTPPPDSVEGAWKYTKAVIEKEHVGFDSGIGYQLMDVFANGTAVTDIGAGVGQLGGWLKDHGANVKWTGFDGGYNIQDFIGHTVNLNPNYGPALKPFVIPKVCYIDASNASLMRKLPKTTWVVSIEVGEHIPKSKESEFLDNLAYLAEAGLIISWAAPGQGGHGHINEQPSAYIIKEMSKRNFAYQADFTSVLSRATAVNCYLQRTLLVFARTGWSVKVVKNFTGPVRPCVKPVVPAGQRAQAKLVKDSR